MEVVSMENDENGLTQQRFEAAVKVIKSLPPDGSFQPSNDMMLKFYSYYKQATLGPCNIPRPGFWDAVGKAKWDAWNSLGEMPKEEAMAAYVDEMKLILEGMPITEEVEGLLRILGPFYELVDEKKKITQISDLSSGIGTMMSGGGGMHTKSMAKSIIRTMEMNGTLAKLQSRPNTLQPALDGSDKDEEELEEDEEEDDDDDEEEDEDEVVIKEVKKENKSLASLPKKKGSARRSTAPLTNGQLAAHMSNGTHSKAALNSDDSQEEPMSATEPQLNGHHIDSNGDACGPQHLTSDSDSEVYCDSVDQFGQEESSENHQSIDDLDEVENHVTEEPHAPHSSVPGEDSLSPPHSRVPGEDSPSPPEGIQCGGEDGEAGGVISQRQTAADSSLVRRGRGSRSSGLGSGAPGPHDVQGSGDGDGEHWGGAPPGGSLNQQIVVALARLQEDMQSVLERLHTLEALTATQARSMALSPTYSPRPANKSSKKPAWWPFDVSPSTVAFAVVWPFVAQWLLRLFLQRRRRRTN